MDVLLSVLRNLIALLAVLCALIGALAFGFAAAVLASTDGRAGQSLGQVWYNHDPFSGILGTASLPLLGALIERKVHPFLWDPLFVTVLGWPSWMALLSIAAFFLILGGVLLGLSKNHMTGS